MDATRVSPLFYKIRRPIPSLQALPGDLLTVYRQRPSAERYVLLRETDSGVQQRTLKERDVLAAAEALGISTREWRRIPVREEDTPARRAG